MNPKLELEKMTGKFNGHLKKKFKNPAQVNMSKKFSNKRKSFYLADDNFGLDKKTIKKITDIIDWDTMGFYGYGRK